MVLVTLITIALTGFGLFWEAGHSDTIAVERQIRIADRAVAASLAALPAAQEPYAVWDEAIERSRLPPDPDWFRGAFVSYFHSMWPAGQVYMLGGDDAPIYAAIGGSMAPAARFEALRPAIADMIDELRGRVPPAGHAHDRLLGGGTAPKRAGTVGRIDHVLHVSHLKRIEGRPAAVSVMRIIPGTARVRSLAGREPLLVNVRFLDAGFMAELSGRHLIDHPRFAPAPAAGAGEASIPLVAEDGGIVAHLIWTPDLPGTRLLRKLAPLAALSALLSAVATLFLVRSLRRATRDLQESERHAQHQALHDTLTGLPNRALFVDRLDQTVVRARRGEPAALLFLDLDRFKYVNDTMGHAAGDAVLREFARRVVGLVRTEDTVARFGGDEFGIIMSRTASVAGVESLCQRLLEATRLPFGLAEGDAVLGVSIGVALLPDAGNERSEVMRAADRALYVAKEAGRDRFHLFRSEPQAGAPGLKAVLSPARLAA